MQEKIGLKEIWTRLGLTTTLGVRNSSWILFVIFLLLAIPMYAIGNSVGSFVSQQQVKKAITINTKNLQIGDVTVSATRSIALANGQTEFYVVVSNKTNATIGFYPWKYELELLGSNNQVLERQSSVGSDFLLPGTDTYLIYTAPKGSQVQQLRLNNKINESKAIQTTSENTTVLKNPDVKVQTSSFEETGTSGNKKLKLSFDIRNNDRVVINELKLLYIIRGTNQEVVGIGVYVFQGLQSLEQRRFDFEYPYPQTGTPKFLETRLDINYLDSSNVKLAA